MADPEDRKIVVVLDDHPVIRHALTARLRQEPYLHVAADFGTSQDLIAFMARHPVDVVVADYSLAPGEIDGLKLIRSLRKRYPKSRVLVMSSHFNPPTVAMAIQAGACGFIGKSQSLDDLIKAIYALLRGGTYVSPTMASQVHSHPVAVDSSEHTSDDREQNYDEILLGAKLSPREYDVVRCCLDGMSTSQIAAKFSRQASTVSTQKKAAFRKLGVGTLAELFKMRSLIQSPRSRLGIPHASRAR